MVHAGGVMVESPHSEQYGVSREGGLREDSAAPPCDAGVSWFAASDRMPEQGRIVLVQHTDDVGVIRYCVARWDGARWRTPSLFIERVTHWRPVPPPPFEHCDMCDLFWAVSELTESFGAPAVIASLRGAIDTLGEHIGRPAGIRAASEMLAAAELRIAEHDSCNSLTVADGARVQAEEHGS